jgi:hypothetical protein
MKTRGLIDFYLPRHIAYHIKIMLASSFATFLFHLIKGIPYR